MKTEFLKELGLTQEQIDKIMAENGKDVEKYKTAAEGSKAELDGLKTQLAERDTQLKELQANAGDNTTLKQQLEALQQANKEQQTAFNQQMQEMRFQSALSTELLKANVVDADLVGVKLDKNKVKLNEDGTLTGLSEQLETLKKDYSFLFKQQEGPTLTGAKPVAGASAPPATSRAQLEEKLKDTKLSFVERIAIKNQLTTLEE